MGGYRPCVFVTSDPARYVRPAARLGRPGGPFGAVPYRDPERKREADRRASRRYRAKRKRRADPTAAERMRRYRERKRRAAAASAATFHPLPPPELHEADALAAWSAGELVVPPGHPRAGQPLTLPPFGVAFLRDALAARESLLCVARKNAKSAIIAVYLLGRLAGPLRSPGYRAGVVSVTKEKSAELLRQMHEITEASGLAGVTFRRSPAPGRLESATGTVEFFSADRASGHASGFDDSLIDELGLLPERRRELVAGMRSAVAARDGRVISLSILGDSPFTRELLERRADPAVVVHHYSAPEGAALDDEAGWHAANPGLAAGVKSLDYMRDAARAALAVPADAAAFRAHDLNQSLDPARVLLCDPTDWRACLVADLPPRAGGAVIGFDLGGAASMTAAAAIWPASGRLELYAAFPDTPDLETRGAADGVGRQYRQMHERGELWTYGGRVTPVAAFLRDVAGRLAGQRVVAAGADRYRKAEAIQALERAGVRWPMSWRGTGASATADGSHDVRAAQRLILTGRVAARESLVMGSAIANSSLRYDAAGNPALERHSARGRIDALQAFTIAAGLAEIEAGRPRRGLRWEVA